MKFLAIALAATAASAAAVRRSDNVPNTSGDDASSTGNDAVIRYDVTEFEASCIAHSSQCSYSFKVKQHASMETNGVFCSALVTADAGNTLPAVTDGVCDDSSRTWSIVKSASDPANVNLSLFVSQPISPNSNTTGVHTIQYDELKTVSNPTNPNGNVQGYVGPEAFDLVESDN